MAFFALGGDLSNVAAMRQYRRARGPYLVCAAARIDVHLVKSTEAPVRRDKAALSSGCKPHPATAPAGSNRSSHGGNEVAEAFD